jgi:hypothetical protein
MLPVVDVIAGQNVIPDVDSLGRKQGVELVAALIAALAPAAALGAMTGAYLAEVTPKQVRYAKIGAVAGLCVVAAVMALTTSGREP